MISDAFVGASERADDKVPSSNVSALAVWFNRSAEKASG